MKRIILFLFLILFLLTLGGAKEVHTKTHRLLLENIQELSIQLEGNIIVNACDVPVGEVVVETIVTGFVWGIQANMKKSLQNYDVEIIQRDNRMTIKEKPKGFSFVIGISTLSAKHRHMITVPRDILLTIRSKQASIRVNGDFQQLRIFNQDGPTHVLCTHSKLKLLSCVTQAGNLQINGTQQTNSYYWQGDGRNIVVLESNQGRLHVDLL